MDRPSAAAQNNLSPVSLWISKLRTAPGFKPGWYAPGLFSDRSFAAALVLMLCHSTFTGILLYMHAKGMISLRIKNLYSISLFITILGGGLYILKLLTLKRAILILANTLAAVLWECIFVNNYKMLSPMFFINSAAIIYWTVADPQLAAAIGIRRDNILKDVLSGGAISVICFAYIVAALASFGYPPVFDFWKNLKHSAIVSGQNLLAFTLVYAIWKRLHKSGLSDTNNIFVLFIIFLTYQTVMVTATALGNGISFFNAASALTINTLLLTIVAHITFKKFDNILPIVFVMTLVHEAMLMAKIL